jgi:acyl carrier protein
MLIEKLRVPRERDEIDPDTPLFGGGLELDSIDAVDLLVHLSTDFGVDLPGDLEGRIALRSVNSLVDLALAEEERRRAVL